MTTANTLYTLLGVAPDASIEAIDSAFRAREQALQGQGDEISLLRVAHDTLRNPAQRAAYDRKLAQQQQAASTPVPLEITYTAAHAPRSRALNWLVLLLAAGGTIGFFWLKKPAPAAAKPALANLASAAPAPFAANSAPVVQEPQAAPAEEAEPASAAAPPAAPPGAQMAEARPAPVAATRGAKQPGFDAQYLAWSVFTIRQRNLSGSGVMIGPDRILTNCHVLAGGATNGLVVISGMSRKTTKVEKYARLDGEDACLLLAPGAGSDSIAWGSSASLRPGDTVHTFGHPGGSSDIIWSEGAFRTRAERGGETFLLSDNYCRPGSSGGPLLDNEGRLVGVVAAVQRFQAKGGDAQYGACISVTEATARALLSKPLFPIALAPAQYIPNY
ncbi:MAG: trypsin-like peptidase domain-containing protein [Betaproteobacteria bacterium]|uniref:Trypsin-like peptidase domain-containing protein n=1 Tax=Candidatus Proximibacter danicus TaxID=2954365 RepID=A0A9D7K2N0_9PROT|nr:trypsin-like peptidase domain-containing protein [Candidatus Proximibacter danicus]